MRKPKGSRNTAIRVLLVEGDTWVLEVHYVERVLEHDNTAPQELYETRAVGLL